ncbi:type IX secretion system anionic LPS delivery protein PorZ [Natronoflexus pectinivorans]|uniref:Putative secreted protein (Por secretion system target) n=1 Tax=Natronoflexus pectinivorans TaxID=682526 RepID=A0A4R2GRW4_9BACT|nr:two-component regulator propeller domain-containing protein [Natronoflexus pectinivorans]TCO10916.1 putative secreted protein (Por secretion system target) [Natronoflexus pectinivorans]
MNRFIIIFFLLLSSNILASDNGQLRIGEWQTHFAYNRSNQVISTPNQILGATSLGLIVIEKSDFSVNTLNRVNGLSDYGISALYYYAERNLIIVGYENGNIDIIANNKVININDLRLKVMDGNKAINHFIADGNRLYCATNFGILVINLNRYEIESTYYIGDNASNLQVNQIAIDQEYLYAATSEGVRRARLNAPDIHIYTSWEVYSSSSVMYSAIANHAGRIFAARGNKGETVSIEYIENNQTHTLSSASNFQNIKSIPNGLLVINSSNIRLYNNELQSTLNISELTLGGSQITPQFRDAVIGGTNEIWISDNNNGLVARPLNEAVWSNYLPQGPLTNRAHRIKMAAENLWVVPGGLTAFWNNANIPASASVLNSSGWIHLTSGNTPTFNNSRDLVTITPNPRNPKNVFLSSWGSGIFEVDDENNKPFVKNWFFTPENGLVSVIPGSRFVRIAAASFDRNNVLWISNSEVENGLVAYFPETESWMRYSYETLSINQGMAPMIATSWGHKWLSVFRGRSRGIFVWDDNNTPLNQSDDRYRGAIHPSAENDRRNAGQLLLWDQNGEVITDLIFDMAEDQNGHIWLGTDKGVVVQYQPFSIFNIERPVFTRILVPRRDGTNNADFLLGDKIVSVIKVDGGNRKWLGTQGSGVYLVSPDGSRQIHAFNTTNSPLPSDYINDITINEKTGEVFIATGEGIVSFRGTATGGSSNFSNIYAFPNPVRPEFTGDITITGLMARSNVKITDVSGKLVFETVSVGGQAFWDGRNLWGEPVKSGIYLIFVASEDGSQSGVTKVAIIR